MKICMIWDGNYPWDVRVEKIGTTLVEFGHDVYLVSRNERRLPRREYLDGMNLCRLPWLPDRYGQLNKLINFPFFFNPVWIREILKVIYEIKAEIILVRDLPLALTAILAGKIKKLPVIMDMAEDYPEQLRGVWHRKGFKLKNLFVRNPWIAKVVERIALKLLNHIIVVIDESKMRLESLGVSPNKISIISNTPSIKEYSPIVTPRRTEKLKLPASSLRLGYVGLLDNERGLDVAVKAMPQILEKYPDATLVIAGSGKFENILKTIPHQLGIENHVIFLGWIIPEVANQYILDCDINVIPHYAVSGWNNTIPNKLFNYMLHGKPVLVSSAAAQARIVSEEKCGLVFVDRDPQSFAKQACKLTDPKLRFKMGKAGQRAILERYNWELDSQILKEVLIKFSGDLGND